MCAVDEVSLFHASWPCGQLCASYTGGAIRSGAAPKPTRPSFERRRATPAATDPEAPGTPEVSADFSMSFAPRSETRTAQGGDTKTAARGWVSLICGRGPLEATCLFRSGKRAH